MPSIRESNRTYRRWGSNSSEFSQGRTIKPLPFRRLRIGRCRAIPDVDREGLKVVLFIGQGDDVYGALSRTF